MAEGPIGEHNTIDDHIRDIVRTEVRSQLNMMCYLVIERIGELREAGYFSLSNEAGFFSPGSKEAQDGNDS